MTSQIQLILVVLLILQIKHFLADFVLQTPYQLLNKGSYGHPGGLLHAGVHALGTMFAFFIIVPSFVVGVVIVVGEFVAHYHIDWLKERMLNRKQWDIAQAGYWRAFGADQGLHQLTYLVIAAVLATQIAR